MGYGSYHEDVRTARHAISTTRQSARAFDYNERAASGEVQSVHADLNILGKVRECCDSQDHPETTPIVVGMDVTKSRGRDAKVIYEQVPAFLGALKVTGIVPDPQIMWAAIGDANTDRAPLQASQFESDRRIDAELRKIWMEEGGGGSGEESYELLAYYLAHKTKLDATRRNKKGFVFFTGDEAPYDAVSRDFVRSYIGDSLKSDVPSREAFEALQGKFHAFLIFPRSSMEERQASIDTEIRQRLEKAGGRFREVDIRASLIWDTRDDLDLHCLTPGGYHIHFASKRADCGGELDVDRNVRGEDPKPVENIRWAKGDAKAGWYEFWVENYRPHETRSGKIAFRVELDINGEIKTYKGKIPWNHQHDTGRFQVARFHFTPGHCADVEKDGRAAYRDEVVLAKWGRYIPATQILRVEDPASVVEVMLGAMALQNGTMDLERFVENMRERRVSAKRQDDACSALSEFASLGVARSVPDQLFA